MKTTLDIPDSLLVQVKALARVRNISMKKLVGEALTIFLRNAPVPKKPFKLKKRPFHGNGLSHEFVDASWDTSRNASYDENE